MRIFGVFVTSRGNETTIVMKLIAKARFFWQLIILLLISVSLVSFLTRSSAVTVGEKYGGGVVFYVDGSGHHGLVVAKTDMPSSSSGRHEGEFTWYDANVFCDNLVSNGYSDWFLPNEWQLNQLFLNSPAVGGFANIASTGYWSSSEGGAGFAWILQFSNFGDDQYQKYQDNKRQEHRVRAVRAF